jgi:hypothetical protein
LKKVGRGAALTYFQLDIFWIYILFFASTFGSTSPSAWCEPKTQIDIEQNYILKGQDGQQYVVLEVIQLGENENADTTSNTVTANALEVDDEDNAAVELKYEAKPMKVSSMSSTSSPVKKSPAAAKPQTNQANSVKKQADLATAFGFDDEDDDWRKK